MELPSNYQNILLQALAALDETGHIGVYMVRTVPVYIWVMTPPYVEVPDSVVILLQAKRGDKVSEPLQKNITEYNLDSKRNRLDKRPDTDTGTSTGADNTGTGNSTTSETK